MCCLCLLTIFNWKKFSILLIVSFHVSFHPHTYYITSCLFSPSHWCIFQVTASYNSVLYLVDENCETGSHIADWASHLESKPYKLIPVSKTVWISPFSKYHTTLFEVPHHPIQSTALPSSKYHITIVYVPFNPLVF